MTRDELEPKRQRRRPKPHGADLMGAYEVAHELGIDVANVGRLHGMPEPISELKATRVWFAPDIRKFAATRTTRRSRSKVEDGNAQQLGKVG